jgi:hypothetical protein
MLQVSTQHLQWLCLRLVSAFCLTLRKVRKICLPCCNAHKTDHHLASCSAPWRRDMLDKLGLVLIRPDCSRPSVQESCSPSSSIDVIDCRIGESRSARCRTSFDNRLISMLYPATPSYNPRRNMTCSQAVCDRIMMRSSSLVLYLSKHGPISRLTLDPLGVSMRSLAIAANHSASVSAVVSD